MFVTTDPSRLPGTPVFSAPAGLHAHFPAWSTDGAFIYFVQGELPEKLDVWRMTATGAGVERMTNHNGRVSHPVSDRRTLLYLATDADGQGPWLYSLDVHTRETRRVLAGVDRHTSLAAAGAGNNLVMTVTHPKRTLWRVLPRTSDGDAPSPTQVGLPNGTGFFPRLGRDVVVYGSTVGGREHLWKLADREPVDLWSAADATMISAPALSPDHGQVAFSALVRGRTLLYVLRIDGSDLRVLTDSLTLSGSVAWTPDGRFITSAATDRGTPKLVNIPLDGSTPIPLVPDYSTDPLWSPDGRTLVYSGPDIGTTFTVRSTSFGASSRAIPPLTLTRGSRHAVFLSERHALVLLRGEIRHKDLYEVDLDTGHERALTHVGPDFTITDFDISPDGRTVLLERSQENSNIVLLKVQGQP